ncbi:N-succinyl-L,L-diaminopimelate aminotransferase alternative [Snodgrassella alvi wkB2]|uniref:Putative 8-amino-7-oxononanoate synthase n=1 Tax=Snodgrassella alvi TaxID=1196083 RepID=A0ABD7YZZ1_9NEIS|nr:succinyldiaminopimelate transaminase [Snodgrassella alvi]AHN28727.1 N-succinyl-L,L-diaminopimelate aminotransferase alternative [Snodgrassella alvi wkB2]PIT45826.1 succinyldiaminopimelate transaminase [Snodgrassella alvi]UOO98199.1 succinyldiaminopimelate transaminase [Snodgrassella alvi wkB2]WLS97848.1 succinyldiaminopimelate transaminase [Snodgrassella alvi]
MNPKLELLQPYPFARLRKLMDGLEPPADLQPISLHIGEPKHPTPSVLTDALIQHLDRLAAYPVTAGIPELRQACAQWLMRRYSGVKINPDTEVLPVLGSREALFAFTQTIIDNNTEYQPVVVSPNPFYQIYEGSALLAGARVEYVNCRAPHFMPQWQEIDQNTWPKVQLVFVCSPGNPSGAVMNLDEWKKLFDLQDKYGFVIASDECYSEIYFDDDNKPLGALQAASQLGRTFDRLIMFTSLSKRSNAPGLRSGFVAGDSKLLADFLLYRTYHGSAMSLPTQYASIAAWNDEEHVIANRNLYREKFDKVIPILQQKFALHKPDASFYLWLNVPDCDDLAFTQKLWQKAAIRVLPGRYLARNTPYGNSGAGFVRIALVSSVEECVEAANRMVKLAF